MTNTSNFSRDFDGFAQDCDNSIANAQDLLQFYVKPSI